MMPKEGEREEFFGELVEKTTSVTVRDFTREGVRLSFNSQGQIKGHYNAIHMETVDVLIRPDGTSDVEGRGLDLTEDGEIVLTTGKGRGKQVSPTTYQSQGEVSFQTASEKLAWLNAARGRWEGSYDAVAGEVVTKFSRESSFGRTHHRSLPKKESCPGRFTHSGNDIRWKSLYRRIAPRNGRAPCPLANYARCEDPWER